MSTKNTIIMPPSKKGGHIALLLCGSPSVHQQFPFIFFAQVAHQYEVWYTDLS
jgi:hypothetical protein